MFFPSFLACKLPSLLPRSCLPFPSLPPPFPRLSSPVLLGNSGRRGGRLPARSPRWLPSTGLSPLDSLPSNRAEIWEEKYKRTLRVFFFFPLSFFSFSFSFLVINPDEVSCLLLPFRAVIFLMKDECFGVPFPCVWGGLACGERGVLNTLEIILSWL